jgi:molybdopterin-binding protein
METSARNNFTGIVKHLIKGPVTAEVTIPVGPGMDVVATIGTRSAEALGLAVGQPARTFVEAGSVIVAVN